MDTIEIILLTVIVWGLSFIIKKIIIMGQELDELTARVAAEGEVVKSAITLLTGLKQQLDAAIGDPAALQALSDQLGTQTDALASAVAANTPAA